jgi:hypothetical protein
MLNLVVHIVTTGLKDIQSLTTSVDAEAVLAAGPHHLAPATETVVVSAPVAAE